MLWTLNDAPSPPPYPSRQPGEVAPRGILLINPFYPKDPHTSLGKHVLTPTTALTTLAGATPRGWKVRCWDENLMKGAAPRDPVPEVVGISVHLTYARRAYQLARIYRSLGAKVVLGGLHVTARPDEAAAHADAIVVGEGSQVWPTLLDDLRAGKLQPRYTGSFAHDYDQEPIPERGLLPQNAFLTTSSLIATRGCTNRCNFCYLATRGLRMPYRRRSIESVVKEIRALGDRYVVFTDNNLTADPAYALELCQALEQCRIVWSAAVTIDAAKDPELLSAMARSGCQGVFIGYESMQQGSLMAAGKRTAVPAAFGELTGRFHDVGIQVNGSFVFGFDHDGPSTFEETVAWIEEHRLSCATFHILTPYPGTPLFDQLDAEGRILTREWSLYDTGHVVFKPKLMSVEQLEAGYAWCYRRLFSHGSIWRRRPDAVPAAAAYLAMSYLYKKANPLWRFAIRHELTRPLWRPLVMASWLRHQLQLAKRSGQAAVRPEGHRTTLQAEGRYACVG